MLHSGIEKILAVVPLVASLLCMVVDAQGSFAIRMLVLTLFICSSVIVFNRFRMRMAIVKTASTFLIIAFVFWYAYPAVVTYFVPSFTADMAVFEYADDNIVIKSLALLSLYLFCFVIMSDIGTKKRTEKRTTRFGEPNNPYSRSFLFWISLGTCLGGTLPYFMFGLGLSEIKSAIIDSRIIDKPWLQLNNLGNIISPFTFIASSAMIAGAAALWLIAIDRNMKLSNRIVAAIIAFSVSSVLYFDQGTRANLALIMSPAILIFFLRIWKRSRLAVIAAIVAITLGGILILQYQMLYRSSFTRNRIKDLLLKDWYTLSSTIDYFRENVFAVSIVPSGHEYFRESNVIQFITSPIPRFLWPNKPTSEVVRFYTLARWDIDILAGEGNTFPGIVGQYYMSWGWLGPIIIGLIFGWLARMLDIYLTSFLRAGSIYHLSIGILAFTWMFLCYRILSPAYLYSIIIFATIVTMSNRYAARRIRGFRLKATHAKG
jgi:oligosaccharide repeat unit polymerase